MGIRPHGLPQAGPQKWKMVTSLKLETPPGTSLKSLVKGYLLTHQTQGSSPNTVEYYRGILGRFLWYGEANSWSDDVRLVNEWQIREFLGYVGTETSRWDKQSNGSESSSRKTAPRTVHHYYGALRAFFNWMIREGFHERNTNGQSEGGQGQS